MIWFEAVPSWKVLSVAFSEFFVDCRRCYTVGLLLMPKSEIMGLDLRKYYFSRREVNTWDGQPVKVIFCIRVTLGVVVLGKMLYSSLLSFPRITPH